jgi:hypothetical protein
MKTKFNEFITEKAGHNYNIKGKIISFISFDDVDKEKDFSQKLVDFVKKNYKGDFKSITIS